MITASMMDAILDHCPQLPGFENFGPEPSLRALILNYYLPHASAECLEELVGDYCRLITDYAVLEL